MRKIIVIAGLGAALALPSSAAAFHHASIPASTCANANAGSPSNDNGNAKGSLRNINPNDNSQAAGGLPLPPVGTPGAGQGRGDENCAANGN